MPKGIFNPYSDIKTYILLINKTISSKTDNILFIKVENDGFDLGAQRRPIEKNDLPDVIKFEKEYYNSIMEGKLKNWSDRDNLVTIISKTTIVNNNYILTSEKLKPNTELRVSKYEMVCLDEILDYEQPTKYIVNDVNYSDEYNTPVLTAGKTFILGYTNEVNGIFNTGLPVIIFDDFTTSIQYVDFPFKVKSSAMKILSVKNKKANIKYMFYLLKTIKFNPTEHKRYWISEYSKIKVPLPSLKEQEIIVKNIESSEIKIKSLKEEILNTNHEIIQSIQTTWGS